MKRLEKKEKEKCYGNWESCEKCNLCGGTAFFCFIETMGKEECFSNSLNFKPARPMCSEMDKRNCNPRLCANVLWIISKSKEVNQVLEKNCFIEFDTESADCFLCKFKSECRIAAICARNQADEREFSSPEEIRQEIRKTLVTQEDCFGQFNFDEKECWNCDYTPECMESRGFMPTLDCRGINREERKLLKVCREKFDCPFADHCENLIQEENQKIMEIEKTKKLYRKFYTIEELREAAFEEA